MSTPIRVAIIGDYNPEYVSHATNGPAIEHAAASLDVPVDVAWVGTDTIAPNDPAAALDSYDAIWMAAGTPYRSRPGAMAALRYARETGRPMFATCGGFQVALLEFAHDVIGRTDLEHAEDVPNAERHLLVPVSCPVPHRKEGAPALSGKLRIHIREESKAREILDADRIEEEYFCNYEVNEDYDELFEEHGMEFTGFGDKGETRIFELTSHPFYLGVLFQPQRKSRPDEPHPFAVAWIEAAARERARRGAEANA
ncbi:MAG: glutamine amidotransferase-related protein [Hyphomicrobiales bacterium]